MVKSLLRKISNDVFNVDIFRTDKKIIHLIDNKKWPGFHTLYRIQNFLEERKIDLIIDVGANRGQFAQDMANLCNIEVFLLSLFLKCMQTLFHFLKSIRK